MKIAMAMPLLLLFSGCSTQEKSKDPSTHHASINWIVGDPSVQAPPLEVGEMTDIEIKRPCVIDLASLLVDRGGAMVAVSYPEAPKVSGTTIFSVHAPRQIQGKELSQKEEISLKKGDSIRIRIADIDPGESVRYLRLVLICKDQPK